MMRGWTKAGLIGPVLTTASALAAEEFTTLFDGKSTTGMGDEPRQSRAHREPSGRRPQSTQVRRIHRHV